MPRKEGGLGFRNFQAFNQALLAKQSWRILTQSDLLISMIYKGKYLHSSHFLEARKCSHPTWGWQSVLHGRDLLITSLLWQLGSNPVMSICRRAWVPGRLRPMIPVPRVPVAQIQHVQISSLLQNGTWNMALLRDLCDDESVQDIESIPIPVTP
ncbi:Uncharacterized mitochondrial protein AtMg00310 [Linum perenne]